MREKMEHPIYDLAKKGYDFEVLGSHSSQKNNVSELFSYLSDNLAQIPWKDLEKRGWIKGERNISSLAPLVSAFFNESTGKALFRKSKRANETILPFWLSRIETQAKIKFIDKPNLRFEKEAFNPGEMAKLAQKSVDPNFIREIPAYLHEFGILLVYEQGLPGMKADGVVMRLENGAPVIGMSLRFTRLDNFWFTLFHELAHIVLHYDIIKFPLVEENGIDSVGKFEVSANRLAQNAFVARNIWNRCPPKYEHTEESIVKFAEEQNIHPAIVAGMLQKETNRYDRYRSLVDSVNVVQIIKGAA